MLLTSIEYHQAPRQPAFGGTNDTNLLLAKVERFYPEACRLRASLTPVPPGFQFAHSMLRHFAQETRHVDHRRPLSFPTGGNGLLSRASACRPGGQASSLAAASPRRNWVHTDFLGLALGLMREWYGTFLPHPRKGVGERSLLFFRGFMDLNHFIETGYININ